MFSTTEWLTRLFLPISKCYLKDLHSHMTISFLNASNKVLMSYLASHYLPLSNLYMSKPIGWIGFFYPLDELGFFTHWVNWVFFGRRGQASNLVRQRFITKSSTCPDGDHYRAKTATAYWNQINSDKHEQLDCINLKVITSFPPTLQN